MTSVFLMSSSASTLPFDSQQNYTQWIPFGYAREQVGDLIKDLVVPRTSQPWNFPGYSQFERRNQDIFKARLKHQCAVDDKAARKADLAAYIARRKIKQMGRDMIENMRPVPRGKQSPQDEYGFQFTSKNRIFGYNEVIFVRYWQSNFSWASLASYKDYLNMFLQIRSNFIRDAKADPVDVRVSLRPLPPILFYYHRNLHIEDMFSALGNHTYKLLTNRVLSSYRLTRNYFNWVQSNPNNRYATLKQYRMYIINKYSKNKK